MLQQFSRHNYIEVADLKIFQMLRVTQEYIIHAIL
jgi:hypothetical protein